jgi:pimeloyl-ACP methyl ester carboxylesterase
MRSRFHRAGFVGRIHVRFVVTALSIVIGVVVGLALLTYAGFLAARYFFVPRYPDEIHFASTSDGWRLAISRYRPGGVAGGGPQNGADCLGGSLPVLMVHGIAANRHNFDLTDELSLARHLAAKGHDVWVVELRGRGLSTRPRLFSQVRYDWTFDEYAERDLPAAVETVLRASGADRLHLVGFSTGALACYAFLTDVHRTIDVASLVSIGGPSSFKRLSRTVSGRLIRSLRFLRHRWLMRVMAPVSGRFHPSPLQIIYNPENTDGATQRRVMVNMIANFSRNELLQYSDWILYDVFRSIDHRRDYRAELGRLEVPTLFLAGPRDVLAPPDAVKVTFESIGATDKEFRICSRGQGMRVNYGHFDLLVGRESPSEIFPLVAGWIESHERPGLTVRPSRPAPTA